MTTQRLLFEDLALVYDSWVKSATDAISSSAPDLMWTDSPEAFQRLGEALRENNQIANYEHVISEVVRGVLHSALVIFDGGTKMAEITTLTVTDEAGQMLPKDLHEQFVSFLIETGRLK